MRVLVNAASVKESGARVVLEQLLHRMREARSDIVWAVALHPSLDLERSGLTGLSRVDIGDIDSTPFGLLRWYEAGLPAAAARFDADVVFSITNYLPLRRMAVPTVLLVQHAGHFSEQFDALNRRYLRRPDRIAAWRMKTRWVERSARAASELTVQTCALADAITATTGRPRERIGVIAHGTGAVAAAPSARRRCGGSCVRIGYVSSWGVQKNFETLLGGIAQLRQQGRDVRLVLTLDYDLPQTAAVMRQAKDRAVADAVENLGKIEAERIAAVYDSLDIFAFPSLVESFGFPLVEAMARGLPIVAADTPSNRELAKDVVSFFPPTDAEALASTIGEIIDDPLLRQARSEAALRRAQDFSWQRAAEQTLRLFDAAMASNAAGRVNRAG